MSSQGSAQLLLRFEGGAVRISKSTFRATDPLGDPFQGH
jgi:hypothetical protein